MPHHDYFKLMPHHDYLAVGYPARTILLIVILSITLTTVVNCLVGFRAGPSAPIVEGPYLGPSAPMAEGSYLVEKWTGT